MRPGLRRPQRTRAKRCCVRSITWRACCRETCYCSTSTTPRTSTIWWTADPTALARDYQSLRGDPAFLAALDRELIELAGRPTSLFLAERLSAHVGGARIYCKREDFAVAGSHLLMAIVGQALAAKRMGRKTLVSGTVYGRRA